MQTYKIDYYLEKINLDGILKAPLFLTKKYDFLNSKYEHIGYKLTEDIDNVKELLYEFVLNEIPFIIVQPFFNDDLLVYDTKYIHIKHTINFTPEIELQNMIMSVPNLRRRFELYKLMEII